jgi:tRNA/tmRNA/rRNA uracil-C5-methylase (TrmA/RlmC/RlmD family)
MLMDAICPGIFQRTFCQTRTPLDSHYLTCHPRERQCEIADTAKQIQHPIRALGPFDKILIDPPRDGALAVSKALGEIAQSGEGVLPKRIVYVSCNPATLARDAGVLVRDAGYRMKGAGVVNMFPHTSHVESIALFERD